MILFSTKHYLAYRWCSPMLTLKKMKILEKQVNLGLGDRSVVKNTLLFFQRTRVVFPPPMLANNHLYVIL